MPLPHCRKPHPMQFHHRQLSRQSFPPAPLLQARFLQLQFQDFHPQQPVHLRPQQSRHLKTHNEARPLHSPKVLFPPQVQKAGQSRLHQELPQQFHPHPKKIPHHPEALQPSPLPVQAPQPDTHMDANSPLSWQTMRKIFR